MSAATHTLAADADAPATWERALLDEQLAMLGRLAEMGMELAAAIKDQATPEALAQPSAAAAIAMAFARVSRAVRMSLALQSRLIQDFKNPHRPASRSQAEADEDIAPGSLRVVWVPEYIEQVQDCVGRAAEDTGLDAETVERLTVEAGERLDRDDMAAIMARPFDEVVAMICADLGLKPERLPARRVAPKRPPSRTAVRGGGGPLADPGAKPGEERVVEGEGGFAPRPDWFSGLSPASG
jgi:hypothetical protein